MGLCKEYTPALNIMAMFADQYGAADSLSAAFTRSIHKTLEQQTLEQQAEYKKTEPINSFHLGLRFFKGQFFWFI
jgi:hypothetical protein